MTEKKRTRQDRDALTITTVPSGLEVKKMTSLMERMTLEVEKTSLETVADAIQRTRSAVDAVTALLLGGHFEGVHRKAYVQYMSTAAISTWLKFVDSLLTPELSDRVSLSLKLDAVLNAREAQALLAEYSKGDGRGVAPSPLHWQHLASVTALGQGMSLQLFLLLVLGAGDGFAYVDESTPLPSEVIEMVAAHIGAHPQLAAMFAAVAFLPRGKVEEYLRDAEYPAALRRDFPEVKLWPKQRFLLTLSTGRQEVADGGCVTYRMNLVLSVGSSSGAVEHTELIRRNKHKQPCFVKQSDAKDVPAYNIAFLPAEIAEREQRLLTHKPTQSSRFLPLRAMTEEDDGLAVEPNSKRARKV